MHYKYLLLLFMLLTIVPLVSANQPSITTLPPYEVNDDKAIVSLDVFLHNQATADVKIQYRFAGSDDPYTNTTTKTVTSNGVYFILVNGLEPATSYEYRAHMQYDSTVRTGTTLGFTTTATSTPLFMQLDMFTCPVTTTGMVFLWLAFAFLIIMYIAGYFIHPVMSLLSSIGILLIATSFVACSGFIGTFIAVFAVIGFVLSMFMPRW